MEDKSKQQISFSEAWSDLKASPKGLYVIFFLKFLESYSYFSIIYTLIIFLSEEFKYSDEQAGWCYGLFGMCTSLYGFIFGGFLIDNLGVKFSLSLGCSILLAGRCLLVICTEHYQILLILYTILPIGTCLGIPVMQIAIRRFTTDKSRSLAYSIFYAMMNVSAIFSASAIDFFRKYVSDRTVVIMDYKFELTAYRALFLSGACTTVISLLTSLIFINNNLEKEQQVERNEEQQGLISDNDANGLVVPKKKIVGPFDIIKEVTSQKSFWKFVCMIILLMGVRIVYRHLDATFPKYMIREFGKNVMYGSIIAINPFLIVILIPIFAPLSYQFSAYAQITFGAFITSLSPFFLLYGPQIWSCVMFVVILSIGEALWSPRLYEYTIFITEKGREGIYMALASSPMFIATLVTGATSGLFLEKFCPENGERESWKMWLLIGLITITSPILLFFFKNKLEITTEELQNERILKKKKDEIRKKFESDHNILKIDRQAEVSFSNR
jgi:MFS family permease